MALNASKQEIVAFDQVMDAFEDTEVMTKAIPKQKLSMEQMERTRDAMWFPEPYVLPAYSGIDQTAGFGKTRTQLSVPAYIDQIWSAPFTLSAKELRDSLQDGRLGDAAKQVLGSHVNQQIITKMSQQSTITIKRTAAASGFDDIGAAAVQFDEQGIDSMGRNFALSSRDWINAAGNLASRSQTDKGNATMNAYESAQIPDVAGFKGLRLPYSWRLALAAGGAITTSTLDAAVNYYTPLAIVAQTAGEIRNVDNRYQSLLVSATANVKVGDKFTIANVWAVHHITKLHTPSLKTFTVTAVIDGTHLQISPPVISNQVASDAGEQYQNCYVSAKAAGAAITWLNTADSYVNPIWHDNAIRIFPGRLAVQPDAGMMVLSAETKSGMQLTMSKQASNIDYTYRYRFDIMFGINIMQPEMTGCILFSQA